MQPAFVARLPRSRPQRPRVAPGARACAGAAVPPMRSTASCNLHLWRACTGRDAKGQGWLRVHEHVLALLQPRGARIIGCGHGGSGSRHAVHLLPHGMEGPSLCSAPSHALGEGGQGRVRVGRAVCGDLPPCSTDAAGSLLHGMEGPSLCKASSPICGMESGGVGQGVQCAFPCVQYAFNTVVNCPSLHAIWLPGSPPLGRRGLYRAGAPCAAA